MKRFFLFIGCYLLFCYASGQNVPERPAALDVLFERATFEDVQIHLFTTDSYKSIYDGSPFLYEEWIEGEVFLKSGESYRLPMKYVMFNNSFWTKEKDADIKQLNMNERIACVNLNSHKFVVESYLQGKNTKTGFVEQLYRGKSGLFKHYSSVIEKGRESNGYQQAEKNYFTKQETLYYFIDSEIAQVIPRNKKEFFAIFGEKGKDVEKFFKERRLKLRESDMAELFRFYDSIDTEN